MDASDRGVLLNRLADLLERDRVYLAVCVTFITFNIKNVNFFKFPSEFGDLR